MLMSRATNPSQGALKGTNLRGQTEPERRFSRIFADSRLLLENEAFWKRRCSQKTADFRRKPQKTAGARRKPLIGVCPLRFVPLSAALNSQGRILAVWILAAKLPNSDLNFAVDFLVDFSSYFFQRKRPEKIHQKIARKIHPGLCSEKFPSDFCRSLFLINSLPIAPRQCLYLSYPL